MASKWNTFKAIYQQDVDRARLTWLGISTLYNWLKKFQSHLRPIKVRPKLIMAHSHMFSRALWQPHAFCSSGVDTKTENCSKYLNGSEGEGRCRNRANNYNIFMKVLCQAALGSIRLKNAISFLLFPRDWALC